MNTIQESLARNPVFSTLEPEDLQNLIQEAISRDYQKGEWLNHPGDHWPYLFFVERGSISAIKESREGRVLILVTIHPGEVFWGFSFFDEAIPMPVAFVADEPTTLHLWSQDRILPFLLKNGETSWQLAKTMVRRMQRASTMVEELAFQSVSSRLAKLLLDRYDPSGGDLIERDMTLEEMAARIGTTREVVCRGLYRFAENGAIQINRTEFMISDPEILEDYLD